MNVKIDLNRFGADEGEDVKLDILQTSPLKPSGKEKEIAIIGISVQLPLAEHWREFWDHIHAGIDCTSDFPANRQAFADQFLKWTGQYTDDRTYMPGAYLEQVDQFDASFFRMLPTEASLMSPDQRLLLESAWQAIEDAGYGGSKLSGSKTGVYIGHVADLGGYNYRQMIDEWVDPQHKPASVAGNLSAIIASRISYLLDLRGPALVIDTACSSSLVAVHTACQAIRTGDCDLAIAGGVRLNLLPLDKESDKVGMESSDGKTRAFDHQSDGAAMGEGVVTVLLKPLTQAVQDKDHIYAIIKGSAVNQDGTSIGITAPNGKAQTDLYVEAWKDAAIDPESISYIETHGTGTIIGDPIEVEGLRKAFAQYTDQKQFCAIGSLKSNIGHSYQTAGVAGLVKAALALKYKVLPPTLHFNSPNRNIHFMNSPVYVNASRKEWTSNGGPRRSGVSSFGFSGTNCHVVLEEAPVQEAEHAPTRSGPFFLALSALNEEALWRLVQKYDHFFQGDPDCTIDQLCYTANTGRGHYGSRLALIIDDLHELRLHISDLSVNGLHAVKGKIFYGASLVGRSPSASELESDADRLVERLKSDPTDPIAWEELAELYVHGGIIDFGRLYSLREIQRVSLPTYPFERQVHWLNNSFIRKREKGPRLERSASTNTDLLRDHMYYKLQWEPMPVAERSKLSLTGKQVILTNGNPLGEELTQELRGQGHAVIEVRFGTHFQQVSDHCYVVDGSVPDFEKLLHSLGSEDIVRIIQLADMSRSRNVGSFENLNESQIRGTYALLHLTQALVRTGYQQQIELALIGEGVNAVSGEEIELNPEPAALFGLGKVVHAEYNHLLCRAIDIDDGTSAQEVIEELSLERKYYAVAFREGVRYIERFVQDHIFDYPEQPLLVRSHGVYVITGGTGALGLEAAKYLAGQTAVHLVLINRTDFPDRERWFEIEQGTDQALKNKIRQIRDLESMGSTVTCYAADVTSLGSMDLVIQDVRQRFGAIHGVIHSAGVAGDGFLVNKSPEAFDEVYMPKVHGTWILDHLTTADQLDFFILYSSGASLIGEAGQGDYCSGNSYLDAFAAYRNAKGQRTQTINWVKWKDIGLAVGKGSNHDGIYKTLSTAEAMEAFHQIANRDITQIMVGRMNLDSDYVSLMGNFPFELSREIEAVVEASLSKRAEQKLIKTSSEPGGTIEIIGRETASYSETEQILAGVYQEVLGFEKINIYDNFFELGGNSIMLNLMFARLQQLFPGRLKLTDLFSYTSISRLAEFLTEENNSDNNSLTTHKNEITQPDISKLLDDMETGKLTVDDLMEMMKPS